jgi:hypothetical protein
MLRFCASAGGAALVLVGAGACPRGDRAAKEKVRSGADALKAEFRDEVPDRDWVPDSIEP